MVAAIPLTFPLLANNEIHPADGELVPRIRAIASQLSQMQSNDELLALSHEIKERLDREEFLDLRVFDERDRDILQGEEMPGLEEFVAKSHEVPYLLGQRAHGRDLIGLEPFVVGDASYQVALTRPIEGYRIALMLMTEPAPQKAMFAAMVIGALLSLILAFNLYAPLRRLAETARRVRGDDLSVRVDQKVTRRRDEIGDVAREFNRALERIQAADENRKTLLRDVSHELRSPLARLQLAAAIAARSDLREGKDASPELRQVQREGERLEKLISQLLELSQVEYRSGQQRELVQLDEIVSVVVEDAQPLARDRGSQVVLRRCPPLQIFAEAYSISAAVDNLVRNALVHTPPGTEVRVDVDRTGSSSIRIRVSDDGPGVSAEFAACMFEPFVRQSDDAHSGSGIGLALVKRAVEAHGGTIAASAPTDGSGLVMSITLPVA
jgi:signal transduction histidine kinase